MRGDARPGGLRRARCRAAVGALPPRAPPPLGLCVGGCGARGFMGLNREREVHEDGGGGTQPGRGMRSISRPGLMDALRSKGLRDAPGGGMCQQGVRGVRVRWRVRPQEHRERDPSFCLAGGGLGQLCRCRDPGR